MIHPLILDKSLGHLRELTQGEVEQLASTYGAMIDDGIVSSIGTIDFSAGALHRVVVDAAVTLNITPPPYSALCVLYVDHPVPGASINFAGLNVGFLGGSQPAASSPGRDVYFMFYLLELNMYLCWVVTDAPSPTPGSIDLFNLIQGTAAAYWGLEGINVTQAGTPLDERHDEYLSEQGVGALTYAVAIPDPGLTTGVGTDGTNYLKSVTSPDFGFPFTMEAVFGTSNNPTGEVGDRMVMRTDDDGTADHYGAFIRYDSGTGFSVNVGNGGAGDANRKGAFVATSLSGNTTYSLVAVVHSPDPADIHVYLDAVEQSDVASGTGGDDMEYAATSDMAVLGDSQDGFFTNWTFCHTAMHDVALYPGEIYNRKQAIDGNDPISPQHAAEIMSLGPSFFWPLKGTDGTTARTAMAGGIDLVESAAGPVYGALNPADGIEHSVRITDDEHLRSASALGTLSYPIVVSLVWTPADPITSGALTQHVLFHTHDPTTDVYQGLSVQWSEVTNVLYTLIGDGTGFDPGGSDYQSESISFTPTANVPVHILVVARSETDTDIYIDGVLQASSSGGSGGAISQPADPASIGGSEIPNVSIGTVQPGTEISHVAVFPAEPSAYEIDALYRSVHGWRRFAGLRRAINVLLADGDHYWPCNHSNGGVSRNCAKGRIPMTVGAGAPTYGNAIAEAGIPGAAQGTDPDFLLGSENIPDLAFPFTLHAVVNQTATVGSTSWSTILATHAQQNQNNQRGAWIGYHSNNDEWNAYVGDDTSAAGGGRSGVNAAAAMVPGTTYQVVGVFRDYNDIDIYVNGVSLATSTNGSATSMVQPAGAPPAFGGNNWANGRGHLRDGSLFSDAAIFRRELTPAEITSLNTGMGSE